MKNASGIVDSSYMIAVEYVAEKKPARMDAILLRVRCRTVKVQMKVAAIPVRS